MLPGCNAEEFRQRRRAGNDADLSAGTCVEVYGRANALAFVELLLERREPPYEKVGVRLRQASSHATRYADC